MLLRYSGHLFHICDDWNLGVAFRLFFLSYTVDLMLASCVAGVDHFCWNDKFMKDFCEPGKIVNSKKQDLP